MHQALGEFVMPGDVVEVAVTGHGHQRPLGDPRQLLAQADQPEPLSSSRSLSRPWMCQRLQR
jgi:hypothetical protein